MKKRLLVLGMAIICIFGMTACGKAADESAANALGITEEGAINYADPVSYTHLGEGRLPGLCFESSGIFSFIIFKNMIYC